MSDTAATAIAVLAALAAAASFGVAAALQHRQARLTPDAGGVRLLARLAAQPLWLAGIALAALAYGLQALALAFGPLALVAPIGEPFAPIVTLVLGQLLAVELALAQGLDPGQPRGLRKVTSTR